MQNDSMNDALIECVKAAGGSKTVASILWPEKPLNDAQRLLLACLNTERSEKLCPNQTLLIRKRGKDAGSHVGINFICNSLNYSVPAPIEPEDEKAQLMREFIQAQKAMSQLAEKLSHVGLKAVA
jgi:hypothetical protein